VITLKSLALKRSGPIFRSFAPAQRAGSQSLIDGSSHCVSAKAMLAIGLTVDAGALLADIALSPLAGLHANGCTNCERTAIA